MTLLGLDLNATRARAVSGPAGNTPRPVSLEGDERELRLAISLEGKKAVVGKAGTELCRKLPHLVCQDFLVRLGEDKPYVWKAGRHKLDAAQATRCVFDRLLAGAKGVQGLAFVLPAYLPGMQATLLAQLAVQAKLPVRGSVPVPLAAALAGYFLEPWFGLGVVVDVDEHALTLSGVVVDEPPAAREAHLLAGKCFPHLGLKAWHNRLIDGIADRCIVQSRRDPRDSGEAEQSIFDQLDGACENVRRGRPIDLAIQSAHWYQNLILRPDDLALFGTPLARQASDGIRSLLAGLQFGEAPSVLLATAGAGRLPGLLPALQQAVPGATLVVLPPDGLASAGHELAGRFQDGLLPRGHLDRVLPLRPSPTPARHARSEDDDVHVSFDERLRLPEP